MGPIIHSRFNPTWKFLILYGSISKPKIQMGFRDEIMDNPMVGAKIF